MYEYKQERAVHTEVEEFVNRMAAEGWELVCVWVQPDSAMIVSAHLTQMMFKHVKPVERDPRTLSEQTGLNAWEETQFAKGRKIQDREGEGHGRQSGEDR